MEYLIGLVGGVGGVVVAALLFWWWDYSAKLAGLINSQDSKLPKFDVETKMPHVEQAKGKLRIKEEGEKDLYPRNLPFHECTTTEEFNETDEVGAVRKVRQVTTVKKYYL